ncbi:ComEC/Rec2 family competence protein [Spirosoma flavum]|uniref:ComEC/Rec2 family competence protein n=1 Tax=Spirosoma flavum TaxID=2048557 RepID=A0ABW6AUP3_9BACT
MPVPATLSTLSTQGHGFAVFPEVRICRVPNGKGFQHLLFGDYITPPKKSDGSYSRWGEDSTQEVNGETWLKVRSRQEEGWIRLSEIQTQRLLEVNFVDIGQGDGCHLVTPSDEHFIIDAGEGDNMYRFLRWRFNLSQSGGQLPKFTAIISHPDEDHYKGLNLLLAQPPANQKRQIRFDEVFHNTIIQRAGSTLGKSTSFNGVNYLSEFIDTQAKLVDVLGKDGAKSNYEKLLKGSLNTFPNLSIKGIWKDMGQETLIYDDPLLRLEVLAPIPETIEVDGVKQKALRWFADDVGKTKNGHSVVLAARIGKMKILLGGDLNSKSADYLMSRYSGKNVELVKKKIALSNDEQELVELRSELQEIINENRTYFQSEVAKACHHGSHDITNEFLQAVNPIATIISSGDEESFCHPRPETLGAIGKFSRGERPLIYSTELARSSPEYITLQTKNLKTDTVKQRIVSTYGMITLRTDGETAVIAQKLEKPRSSFGDITKWQIDKLIWNDERGEFISKK